MSRQFLYAGVLIAVGILISPEFVSAQGCDTCNTFSPGVAVGAPGGFGFPASNCGCRGAGAHGGCRNGACRAQLRSKLDHSANINAKIIARNEAWPAPFDCGSRQLYHATLRPMIDAGFEDQNLLTDTHFDAKTGMLTKYGIQQVSGMMLNMPTHRRTVFVQQLADFNATQQRMATVKEVLDTYYPQSRGSVQVSARRGAKGYGVEADNITTLRLGATPAPIIPIASGTESVGESASNN